MNKLIASIENDIVVNIGVFDADYEPGPGQLDVTDSDAGVGWLLVNGVLEPPAVQPLQPVTTIEKSAFIARFIDTEFHAWKRAATRADATTSPSVADRAAQKAWYIFETLPLQIDLLDPKVLGFKSAWLGVGITEARANAILMPSN